MNMTYGNHEHHGADMDVTVVTPDGLEVEIKHVSCTSTFLFGLRKMLRRDVRTADYTSYSLQFYSDALKAWVTLDENINMYELNLFPMPTLHMIPIDYHLRSLHLHLLLFCDYLDFPYHPAERDPLDLPPFEVLNFTQEEWSK